MNTPPDEHPTAQDHLELALANLHTMDPEEANLVIRRLLERVHAEKLGSRTLQIHGPRH